MQHKAHYFAPSLLLLTGVLQAADTTMDGTITSRDTTNANNRHFIMSGVNGLTWDLKGGHGGGGYFGIAENNATPFFAVQSSTGYVGIGTSNPQNRLDVNGPIMSSNTTNSINRYFVMSGYNGTTWDLIGGHGGGGFFGIAENNATPFFMVQATTGNVGVGTTNPLGRLDVNGLSSNEGVHTRGGTEVQNRQGAWTTWNRRAPGYGLTEFVNHRGLGSGGFSFWNTNNGTSFDKLGELNQGGLSIPSSVWSPQIVGSGGQNDNVGLVRAECLSADGNASLVATNRRILGQIMAWEHYGVRIGVRSIRQDGGGYPAGLGNVYFTTGADTVRATLNASDGSLVVADWGADPGGTAKLRVGGAGKFSQSVSIGTGGTYEPGAIYSDGNWGLIMRAKQASPALAKFMFADADNTQLLTIDTQNQLLAIGSVQSPVPLSTGKVGLAATVPGGANGQVSSVSYFSTFMNNPDTGPRRTADIAAGYKDGVWGTEYLSFRVGGSNDNMTPTVERMRISANGSVMIGEKAVAGALLSVYGPVAAKEVKVTNTGWADYVLAKDYVLPPLAEVEDHIKAKGHLPGIPSEAEVVRDGLDLGAMQKAHMAKIEELTLYAIEADRERRLLADRVAGQAAQIARLEALTQRLMERLEARDGRAITTVP